MKKNTLVFILIFSAFLMPAQEINPDVYGFATSNTFTYCDINDTSFTNKVLKIESSSIKIPRRSNGEFLPF